MNTLNINSTNKKRKSTEQINYSFVKKYKTDENNKKNNGNNSKKNNKKYGNNSDDSSDDSSNSDSDSESDSTNNNYDELFFGINLIKNKYKKNKKLTPKQITSLLFESINSTAFVILETNFVVVKNETIW